MKSFKFGAITESGPTGLKMSHHVYVIAYTFITYNDSSKLIMNYFMAMPNLFTLELVRSFVSCDLKNSIQTTGGAVRV